MSVGWFSLFVGKHYQLRSLQVLPFAWFMPMKYLYKSVRHTKADSVLLWFPPLTSAHIFLIWLSCGPYFLCVTYFLIELNHVGNFDSLSAHSPKLTSEAYQKIPFFVPLITELELWFLYLLSKQTFKSFEVQQPQECWYQLFSIIHGYSHFLTAALCIVWESTAWMRQIGKCYNTLLQ